MEFWTAAIKNPLPYRIVKQSAAARYLLPQLSAPSASAAPPSPEPTHRTERARHGFNRPDAYRGGSSIVPGEHWAVSPVGTALRVL